MVEIIAFIVFVGSAAGAGMIISRKVPELVALPAEVVHQNLIAEPSRLHTAAFAFRALLGWKQYELALISFVEKMLRRIRVWILKSDALVSWFLVKLQERGRKDADQKEHYWQTLRDLRSLQGGTGVPTMERVNPPRAGRMDGIKKIFAHRRRADTHTAP